MSKLLLQKGAGRHLQIISKIAQLHTNINIRDTKERDKSTSEISSHSFSIIYLCLCLPSLPKYILIVFHISTLTHLHIDVSMNM